jgi:tripartite-type tricarboxylate transporter receptor subunit TctC
MKTERVFAVFALCALLLLPLAAPSFAQTYPAKPIRVVVPWPPGGITDVITRAIGLRLAEVFGQQVVVDNRPGAGGTLGSALVAKAVPDGYTLLMDDIASHCISSTLYTKLSYDPLKDFAPIAMVAGSPMVLIANPTLNVRTLPQLIELAKSKPGQLNYASSGSGAITHLGAVRLQRIVGIDLVHVPFKGSIPATTSVIAGETAMAFSTIPAAVPQAKAGRLAILAVSFQKRSPQLPDVPTIAETVGEYDLGLYSGLWAPAGTPREIIARLHTEFMKAMEQPKVKEILAANSAEPGHMTPAQFGEYLAKEVRTWGEVVRAAGVKIE